MGNCASSPCCPRLQRTLATCCPCIKCQKKRNRGPEGDPAEVPLSSLGEPVSASEQPDATEVPSDAAESKPDDPMFSRVRRPRLPKPPADSLGKWPKEQETSAEKASGSNFPDTGTGVERSPGSRRQGSRLRTEKLSPKWDSR